MQKIVSFLPPPLDPLFLPAALWNRAYQATVANDLAARTLTIALERPDGGSSHHVSRVLNANHPEAPLTLRYAERLLKFLLWQRGGCKVSIAGAPEIGAHLSFIYSPRGERAFDHEFMGEKVYGRVFCVENVDPSDLPEERDTSQPMGRHLDGCRIGFD
ncbi:MAG TPA: ROK family protein, partial [Opitutaceae bacterium]